VETEFLERWSAPQARSETLSKIGDWLRRPKRCVRVDAAACPRFSSRRVRRSLMGDCYQIPITFHHPNPIVDQMAMFTSEAAAPTFHHRRRLT